jgi:hypothetical protein
VLIGILPYSLYVFKLLGNPFALTYPDHDTAFGAFTNYYLDWNENWFKVHILAIAALAILRILKKLTTKELLIWLSFPILNYLFFSAHKMQLGYYPYASFLILLGALMHYFSKRGRAPVRTKALIVLPLILAITMCVDGINRYRSYEKISYQEATDVYRPLCEYDVVWGELLSGTAEYACNNNGFKYNFGTPSSRKVAMDYLKDHNYSQIILCQDNRLKVETISQELNAHEIDFIMKEIPVLGKVLIIEKGRGI